MGEGDFGGVDQSGYGDAEATVFNYWQDDAPVSIDDPGVKFLFVQRADTSLIVLQSWNEAPSRATVRLHGFTAAKALDPEVGSAYAMKGGEIPVLLDRFGLRSWRAICFRPTRGCAGPELGQRSVQFGVGLRLGARAAMRRFLQRHRGRAW